MRAAWAALTGVIMGCGGPGGLAYGDPLPPFTAETLDTSEPTSLDRYRGDVLLVNLWATWCVPCRTETPYLQSLYESYRDAGLEIVGVSVDRAADLDAVRDFVDEMGVEYDILLDPQGRAERVFRARGLPNSILVDREGRVVFSWLGPIEEDDPTFLAGLEETLGVAGARAGQPQRGSNGMRMASNVP